MTLEDLTNLDTTINYYEKLTTEDETDGNSCNNVYVSRVSSIQKDLLKFVGSHSVYHDSQVIFGVSKLDGYIFLLLEGNGEHDVMSNNQTVQELFIRYLNCLQKSDQSKIDVNNLCTVRQLLFACDNIDIMKDIGFDKNYEYYLSQQQLKLQNNSTTSQAEGNNDQLVTATIKLDQPEVSQTVLPEPDFSHIAEQYHGCQIS